MSQARAHQQCMHACLLAVSRMIVPASYYLGQRSCCYSIPAQLLARLHSFHL